MSAPPRFPQGPMLDDLGNLNLEWFLWLQNPEFASIVIIPGLPVTSGGTGLTSGTSGGILGFTSTTTMASSSLLTDHALVIGGGAGATPSTPVGLGTSTTVLHGNASGNPSWGAVSLTGDITGTLGATHGGTAQSTYTQGDILYASAANTLAKLAKGTTGQILTMTATIPSWATDTGTGTVTSVSVTTANGVSGTVATATTTPAISLTLGAITPSSVNSIVLSGSATPTLAVTGTTTVSGANTGDQTSVSGNAGTATALQTARTINGVSFNGTANIVIPTPSYLFTHFASVGNVGTGEDDLYSDTIAAGQLTTNGDKLEVEYGGSFVSSASATRQLRLYFGGNSIFDSGALTLSLSAAWVIYTSIVRVSASIIRYMVSMTTEGAALAAYTAVGEITGLTLGSGNVLKITGESAGVGAATDDIVAKLGSIIYRPF